MLRITLHQMRQNLGRLTAAGIAILIGTAFITATLLAGQVFIKSTEQSMTAQYADSDLVVSASSSFTNSAGDTEWRYTPITTDFVDGVRQLDGLGALAIANGGYVEAKNGEKSEYLPSSTYSTDPLLQTSTLTQGTEPQSSTEVALPEKVADRLKVKIGDSIKLDYFGGSEDKDTAVTFTITGFVKDTRGAFASSGGAAVFTEDGLVDIFNVVPQDPANSLPAENVLITASDKVRDNDKAFADFRAQVEKLAGDRSTETRSEVAQKQIEGLSGEANILTSMVLTFAAIALLVASLVISNTFQVLIAQRTKTLALLRCVGANKKQIKRSVITEALILGVAASVAGILAGMLLVQGVLWVVSALELSTNVPTVISISAMSIWLPLIAGVITTVLASFVPARIATQVAPLAALRPQEGTGEVRRTGKVRIVFAALLTLLGVALFVYGFMVRTEEPNIGLLAGMAGGALTFIGLILSAVLWVPGVVAAVGGLFAKFGAPAQLAAANIGRNPRRTASTSTALFIGVTLVAMLSIGASTARTTLNKELDSQFPLDVTVNIYDDVADMDKTVQQVRNIDGIEDAAALRSFTAGVTQDGDYFSSTASVYELSDAAKSTLRDTAPFAKLNDSTVMKSAWSSPTKKGDEIHFYDRKFVEAPEENSDETEIVVGEGDSASADGTLETESQTSGEEQPPTIPKNSISLEPTSSSGLNGFVVTPATFDKMVEQFGIEPSAVTQSMIFVKVADPSDAADAVDGLRELFSDQSVDITGAVMERAMFQTVIDVMLLVLVGLLGVAVLIALIGVANTLSLSVIERRRESATLRAVGMSRRQLRSSLAMEGMLIAGIGALVGVILGGVYAWLGSELLLGAFTEPVFTVRWFDIAIIFVIALGSGLLASILPGRQAARTSPVAALAVE